MRNVFFIIILFFFLSNIFHGQQQYTNQENSNWKVFTAATNFTSICEIKNELWIGHEGGISVINFDGDLQRTITKENSGLPTNDVSHICIDSSGIIWVGTPLGLSTFNGYEWITYYNRNSPLQNNTITALTVDRESKLWISTQRYNTITANLFCIENGNWKTYDFATYKLPQSYLLNILVSSENKIWIGYWLSLFEKNDDETFRQIDISHLRYGDYFSINNYAIDSEDDIWIAAQDGPVAEYKHDKSWNIWDENNSPVVIWPKKVFIDKNDYPWVGTSDYGLFRQTAEGWKTYNDIGMNGNDINTFYDNGNGTSFWSCRSGFYKFDNTQWDRLNLSNSGLITNNCKFVEISNSGTAYIINSNKLLSCNNFNDWDTLLTISGTPMDITLDSNDNLWIASRSTGGGLNIYNTVTGENTFFNSSNSELKTENISAIEIENNGNIWIGTHGAGVYFITEINDLLNADKVQNFTEKNSLLPHDAVNSIEKNELTGEVWFGCNWYGWAKYDGTNWDVNTPSFGNQINSIVADPNGRVWLATDQVLYSYFQGKWEIEIYEVIKKITLDVDGNIWASRNEHLYKFENGSYSDLHTRFYPFSAHINDIKVDKNNNLWIAGNGLSVLLSDTPSAINEEKLDFPQNFELSQNYPNPFNPRTIINYTIPNTFIPSGVEGANVQLNVYDILGKEVETLINKKQPPGNYQVRFDGRNLPSGVYFYRLQSASFIETQKMLLLR